MVLPGTSLFILETDSDRQVLVVLAATTTGLKSAVERLAEGQMEDCLFTETGDPPTVIALCPTGEVAPGEGEGGWPDEEPEPPGPTSPITTTEPVTVTPGTGDDIIEPPELDQPEGSILVISLDVGEGQADSMTSVEDYVTILEERYDVTVWTASEQGTPDYADLTDYDLIIWTSGDFQGAWGEDVTELLFLVMVDGIPAIASGAHIDDTASVSVQRDIRVSDPTHPAARGFQPSETIPFVTGPSGREFEVDIHSDVVDAEDTGIAFVRGSSSEDEGVASVFTLVDELSGLQLEIIGFPLYLLPEWAKSQLVLNSVEWMLAPY